MAINQGQNQGFCVLNEFVCEAIQAPAVPPAGPTKRGQNEGTRVVQELVVDAYKASTEGKGSDDAAKSRPVTNVGMELLVSMESGADSGPLSGKQTAPPTQSDKNGQVAEGSGQVSKSF